MCPLNYYVFNLWLMIIISLLAFEALKGETTAEAEEEEDDDG